MDDHEHALQALKEYMMLPPLLSKPYDKKVLRLYLTVSPNAVSAVLVREEDNQQFPIYYISKSLLDVENRNISMESYF